MRSTRGRFVLASAALAAWASSGHAQTADPTFSKEIVRILAANCMSCHHTGGIAPMPLTTYEEVRSRAETMREAVVSHAMPPWHAAGDRGVFVNDPTLADADVRAIAAWVAAGAPKGNDKDLPALPDFTKEWPMGQGPISSCSRTGRTPSSPRPVTSIDAS